MDNIMITALVLANVCIVRRKDTPITVEYIMGTRFREIILRSSEVFHLLALHLANLCSFMSALTTQESTFALVA